MREKIEQQRDLLLFLSLLLVIVLYPLLDHGDLQRLILACLTFVPLILATMKMSQRKGWVWPYVLLMSGALISGIMGTIFPNQSLVAIQWAILTVFFWTDGVRAFLLSEGGQHHHE
jgi:hypothetical protein